MISNASLLPHCNSQTPFGSGSLTCIKLFVFPFSIHDMYGGGGEHKRGMVTRPALLLNFFRGLGKAELRLYVDNDNNNIRY